MKQLIEGKITMLINQECTTIELFDDTSKRIFAKVELTNDQLASILSGMARTDCKIEVRNLDLVGKKMEQRPFEFEINEDMIHSRSALNQHCLKALAVLDMKDWIPDNSYASSNTFFRKDGKLYAQTKIRRWL